MVNAQGSSEAQICIVLCNNNQLFVRNEGGAQCIMDHKRLPMVPFFDESAAWKPPTAHMILDETLDPLGVTLQGKGTFGIHGQGIDC